MILRTDKTINGFLYRGDHYRDDISTFLVGHLLWFYLLNENIYHRKRGSDLLVIFDVVHHLEWMLF